MSVSSGLMSCATMVAFEVEHPPAADLRGVSSITVVPFEWNCKKGYERLSRSATSALMNGVRKGKLDLVDPQVLQNVNEEDYWRHADAYISGSIKNVRVNSHTETREEVWGTETVRRNITNWTAVVEIEYNYIRSINGELLGRIRKSESGSAVSDDYRYGDTIRSANREAGRITDRYTDREAGRNTGRNADREARRAERSRGAYLRSGSRAESVAEIAIAKFSNTMSRELGPWTTTERRNVKRDKENAGLLAEAKNFIRQGKYSEALGIYSVVYEQTGGVLAGYNTAVLLQANKKFYDALDLLEALQDRITETGKNSPPYLKKEIKKLSGFVSGYKLLEGF